MSKIFKDTNIDFFDYINNNIIVGNSSKVNNSNYGKYIDSFDSVVRLNDAPIEEYESDVGMKESFRVFNIVLQKGGKIPSSDTSKNYIENLEEKNIILYPSYERLENSVKEKTDQSNKIFITSEEFKDYIQDLEEYYSIQKISTGLFSIILFIHILGESTLINFDFYDSSEDSYHYWEDFDGGDLSSHNFEKEFECISDLIENGNVNLIKL